MSKTPGGEREALGQKLPLSTPFLVQIFPVYACNFTCSYCIYAVHREKRGYISDKSMMDFTLYKKCVDDMRAFDKPLKMLRFAGIGEPLLHPQIAEMVAYARQADIASSIDIVTNGSLLTKDLSQRLLSAGLSKLRISLEGLSSEDYEENSGIKVDFDSLVANLRYFYEHCAEAKLYIKIIDYMVPTQAAQDRFFSLFRPICHEIAIEHLTPTIDEIDYSQLSDEQQDKPQNGSQLIQSSICPQPFYLMQINPDGNVVPCCSMKYPLILGNVQEESVPNIWRGETFRRFQKALLGGVRQATPVCAQCKLYLYGLHEEDRLDEYADVLLPSYGKGD